MVAPLPALFVRTLSVSHHLRSPDWSCCGTQRLRKTATFVPSRWSFTRRHMLDTGELMWTSVKRVGTRGIRPPLVP